MKKTGPPVAGWARSQTRYFRLDPLEDQMESYRSNPRGRTAHGSGQDVARVKKRRPPASLPPSRQPRRTKVSKQTGRRKESNSDPLRFLNARRAQRRSDENAARVSTNGTPMFLKVPARIQARSELSDGAKILHAYFLNVDSKDKKGNVAPYQNTLAEALHVDVRTIRRYIQELENAFLLSDEERGMKQSSVYYLHDSWTVTWADENLTMPWKVQIPDRSKVSPKPADRGRFRPNGGDRSAGVEDTHVRSNGTNPTSP